MEYTNMDFGWLFTKESILDVQKMFNDGLCIANGVQWSYIVSCDIESCIVYKKYNISKHLHLQSSS